MTNDSTPPSGPYPNAPFPTGASADAPQPPIEFDSPLPATPVDRPSPTPPAAQLSDAGSSTPGGAAGDDVEAEKDKAAEVKNKAADAAQTSRQAASEVAGTAADAAKDVAQETQAQAKDLLGKTRSEINDQAATQQDSLVATLRDLSQQFAAMADTDEQGAGVQLVADARDRTRDAAEWLDRRDPGQVVDELRELGRRRPGAFLLGSVVAGVVAGRLTRGVAAVHSDDSGAASGAHRQAGS